MSDAGSRGHLLDTHVLIWALQEPERLSSIVQRTILKGGVFVSVVTYWEATIKSMKGGIDIGDPRVWWTAALEQLSANALLFRPEHVAALTILPPIHQDPFDRALIAQATVEGLTLVSMDSNIARYESKKLRIVR